jgi:hypothetical protein
VYYDSHNYGDNLITDVKVARSTDGGGSFTNYAISDTSFRPKPVFGGGSPAEDPGYWGDYIGIVSAKSVAFPCWMDRRTPVGNDSVFQGFSARVNFGNGPMQAGAATATAYNNQRKMVYHNGKYYAVYEDGGEIYFTFSADSGASWHLEEFLSDGSGLNKYPSMDINDSSQVAVTWQKIVASPLSDSKIFLRRKSLTGTWGPRESVGFTPPSSDILSVPAIAKTDSIELVVWKYSASGLRAWAVKPYTANNDTEFVHNISSSAVTAFPAIVKAKNKSNTLDIIGNKQFVTSQPFRLRNHSGGILLLSSREVVDERMQFRLRNVLPETTFRLRN